MSAPSAKRPVVFRRKSSQSSSESLAKSMETGSSGIESSLETPSPAYLKSGDAPNKNSSESKFIENFSPAKRLPSPSRNKQGTSHARRLSPRQSGSSSRKGAGNTPSGPALSDRRQPSDGDLTGKEHEAITAQRTLNPETSVDGYQPAIQESPERSRRDIFQMSYKPADSKESRDVGPIRYLSSDSKSTASLAPTFTDAKGQLSASLDTDPAASNSSSRTSDKGKRRASDEQRPLKSSTREPMNGNSNKPAFTKSKSQLELVLQRDRARNGDKKGDGRN